jgi:hypothetical protein
MSLSLPAFGAASYVPAIVLERSLFVRKAPPALCHGCCCCLARNILPYSRPTECRRCRPPAAPARTACRERNDGLYRVITYLVCKILEEVFIALLNSIVYVCIVWWTLQLQGSFALFWLAYFVTLSCGIVLAYFIAAMSPNLDVANAALPTYVVTLLFFGGFLIRYEDIPNYWKWYSYIDFLKYAWGALMKNQFNGDRNKEFVQGQTILDYYGFTGISMWGWLAIEACFFVAFFAFAFLALKYVKHVRR